METALSRLHRAEEEVASLREQIKAAQACLCTPAGMTAACMHTAVTLSHQSLPCAAGSA
jgi:hypothetical protein